MRALFLSTILAIEIVLAACTYREEAPSGEVRLDYVSTSESVALFTIENLSASPIKIRGLPDWRKRVDLYRGDYAMFCEKNGERDQYLDGFRDPPEFAEIRPGERVSLRVHTDLTQRYKGGRCQLRLSPSAGAMETIRSNEFVP